MLLPKIQNLAIRMALLAVLLELAGCATSSIDLAPSRHDRPWNPSVKDDGTIVSGPSKSSEELAKDFTRESVKPYTLPGNANAAMLGDDTSIDPLHEYTLVELIDIAQSSNPKTRIAWNVARSAALATGVAKSMYLPHLTATAMGARQRSHGSTDTILGDASSNRTVHGTVSVLALEWLLFDFGGREARVEAAEQTTIASNIAYTLVHQQLIQEVSVAYHAYIAARQRVGNSDQNLANANTILDAATERYKHGHGTVVEVAQARQNREQARLVKVTAAGVEEDTYIALVTAMGLSPLTKLRVASEPDQPLSAKLIKPVENIISEALAQRPDVLAAYAMAQAEAANVRVADASFMPKIFMSASTSHISGRSSITAVPPIGDQSANVNLNGGRSGNNIMIGITLPLYDGGMRSAVRMQMKNAEDSAHERLSMTRQDAARQIVVALNALRTSIAANEAAASLLSAAKVTYDAALGAYVNGVGSLTETALADNQVLLAQNAYADSVSNAKAAAATLAFATGQISLF